MGNVFFKFKKINEDEWEVYANDKRIGNIYKGWHRLGGEGYIIKGYQPFGTYPTQKKAANAMVREIMKNAKGEIK